MNLHQQIMLIDSLYANKWVREPHADVWRSPDGKLVKVILDSGRVFEGTLEIPMTATETNQRFRQYP